VCKPRSVTDIASGRFVSTLVRSDGMRTAVAMIVTMIAARETVHGRGSRNETASVKGRESGSGSVNVKENAPVNRTLLLIANGNDTTTAGILIGTETTARRMTTSPSLVFRKLQPVAWPEPPLRLV
jgi:hypothetical protein